jgi:hypothetical protein
MKRISAKGKFIIFSNLLAVTGVIVSGLSLKQSPSLTGSITFIGCLAATVLVTAIAVAFNLAERPV